VAGLLGSGLAVAAGGVGLVGVLHRSAAADTGSGLVATVPTDAAAGVPGPAVVSASGTPSAGQTPDPAAARPVTVQIPAIAVNTPLELLGIAADGTLQTPTDPQKAGWFTGSALPGSTGPAVIVGHVDSKSGPAVFAHLKKTKVGDAISVTLAGGRRVVYHATSVVTYAKDRFPSQSVYGAVPDSELRLITCGGAFVDGQYVDDVVVFATLSS
jgi:LPXTG-site transpeptidase (sortase) family protein